MNSVTKFFGMALVALLIIPGLALAHDVSNPKNGKAVEVMISHAGRVLVRGATVTAIAGTTITASTTWSGTTLTWTVVTDSTTKFLNVGGKSGTSTDLAVGDTISFAGVFAPGSTLTVRATVVKDWTHRSGTTTPPRADEYRKDHVKLWLNANGFGGFHLGALKDKHDD